jgi:hypothetical protein
MDRIKYGKGISINILKERDIGDEPEQDGLNRYLKTLKRGKGWQEIERKDGGKRLQTLIYSA